MPTTTFLRFLCVFVFIGNQAPIGQAQEGEEKGEKPKEIAGKADVLRHLPKKFATFGGYDAEKQSVTLHVEGEAEAREWPISADGEVKVSGWWGRPEQFIQGDRVWVWFAIDREKKPLAVWMLADEPSEQDIHGQPYEVQTVTGAAVTVHIPQQKDIEARGLMIAEGTTPPEVGAKAYVQSAGDRLREALSPDQFEARRANQKDWLREKWRTEGLPGAISVLHPMGGEMDVVLDHEAMRWARYQRKGAEVTIVGDYKVDAVLKSVSHWRERTVMRLVTSSGVDQLGFKLGERIKLIIPEPPAEVQASNMPTDIGRLEGKQDRIDWFLASVYCTCGIGGDRCTGMFYIQESCNVNACGRPKHIAGEVAEKIDAGKTDQQIYGELLEKYGRELWQPHLLR